ncbi:HDOD domain-containing protein [uncultured Amphritea sp.]|jgi:HD-like signal output (HDOD) protein|uniref:HDOD domain-containing protein n=1 Tax=uncultured Amphritea sp. TaxID=981605 RepID=UPI0026221A1A|nr:HDOD domain-containing protein [uncultured Amphritea sp.]
MCAKPYLIPPRPETLIKLSALLKAPQPDLDAVVNTIKADVSLFTVVMSTANSPLFSGASQFKTLHQAVMRLGLKRLFTLAELILLKRSLSKTGRLDRFWDTSTEVAEIAARLAIQLSRENADQAYALGMLHDCGVPLMIESYPGFRDFLGAHEAENHSALSLKEREVFGVDHFTVGADIAEAWRMPKDICDAIRLQLNYPAVLLNPLKGVGENSKTLFCLVLLAKNISERFRRFWRINSPRSETYQLKQALEYLGLSEVDYIDIRDHYLDELISTN